MTTLVLDDAYYERLGLVHRYRHVRSNKPFTDEQKAQIDANVARMAQSISRRIDEMAIEYLKGQL